MRAHTMLMSPWSFFLALTDSQPVIIMASEHVYDEPKEVLEKEPSPYLIPGQNINKGKASDYQLPEDLEEEFDFLPDKSAKPPAKPSTGSNAAAYQVPDLEEEFDFLPSKPAPPPTVSGSAASALAVPGLAPSLASDFEIVPEKPKTAEEQEYDEVDEPDEPEPAKTPQYENVSSKAADKKGNKAALPTPLPVPEPPAPKPVAAPKPPVRMRSSLCFIIMPCFDFSLSAWCAGLQSSSANQTPDTQSRWSCRVCRCQCHTHAYMLPGRCAGTRPTRSRRNPGLMPRENRLNGSMVL